MKKSASAGTLKANQRLFPRHSQLVPSMHEQWYLCASTSNNSECELAKRIEVPGNGLWANQRHISLHEHALLMRRYR